MTFRSGILSAKSGSKTLGLVRFLLRLWSWRGLRSLSRVSRLAEAGRRCISRAIRIVHQSHRYMVLHGSHQYTPVMLAYIPAPAGSVMGMNVLASPYFFFSNRTMVGKSWVPAMTGDCGPSSFTWPEIIRNVPCKHLCHPSNTTAQTAQTSVATCCNNGTHQKLCSSPCCSSAKSCRCFLWMLLQDHACGRTPAAHFLTRSPQLSE